MDKSLKLLLYFALLTVCANAQYILPGILSPQPFSAGTGTFSLVSSPTHTSCTAVSSCGSFTITNSGDLIVFTGTAGTTSGGTSAYPISVSSGGTLVYAPSTMASNFAFVAYILPSTSTAGTGISVNFSNATNISIKMYELQPSANGSAVGLDNANALQYAATTTPAGPAFTWSGTNDGSVQYIAGGTPSAISPTGGTGYGNTELITGSGWAVGPTPTSGAAATWTTSSAAGVSVASAFGWNVPAGSIDATFVNFETGTSGNNPTTAVLASSTHGAQGCQWNLVNNNLMKFSSAASMPLINTTPRLYGDGQTYASGAGSMGMAITWSGTGNNEGIRCNWETAGVITTYPLLILTFKYNDNFSATDTSPVDCGNLHGAIDYAGANCYGSGTTRYFRIEQAYGGNGTDINATGGTLATACGSVASGQGCTVQVQYNSNGAHTPATSVSASVAGSTVSFSGTFTPALWPLGFSFKPTGCTGGTNYNNNLFYVQTASATTVTASTTSYVNGGTTATTSGSATGCTLTGQDVVSVCTYTGALLGVSFSGAGTASAVDGPEYAFIGDAQATSDPTSGATSYWDSTEIFYSGAQAIPCNSQVL